MIEIRRGKASEYDEIIDLVDFVFSKTQYPHDFPASYPELYKRTDESMRNMITLREDGVLKASVICHPRTLVICGQELKVYGIGSVATHPRAMGRGFMSILMEYAMEELKKEGVHMSNLGGKRSRYNRFGYEISGNSYNTMLFYRDFKSVYPNYPADKYSFKAISKDDKDIIEACKAIYDSKPVHYIYNNEDFHLRMYRNNGTTPYAVYDGKEIIGHLSMYIPEDTRSAKEICLKDESVSSDVLFSFMEQKGCGIEFRVSESQLPGLRAFFDISKDIARTGNNMWKILAWKEVISAFMRRKAEYAYLEPGRLVMDIENAGKFAISFSENGVVGVEDTNEEADIALNNLEATRVIFGPTPEAIVGFINDRRINAIIKSWFPLPLTWFSTESV